MDRYLITGGSGLLGSNLSQRLCALGAEVHATSRARRDSGNDGVRWRQADLADLAQARETFRAVRPTVVYHFAGAVGASVDVGLVLPTFHSLLTSTVNVLLAALEHECRRVILAGSFTEPHPSSLWPAPGSPYAAAKWASCGYGRMFHALYDMPVVILRPYITYGPGQPAGRLIPSVIARLLEGEAPRLTSGRTRADWVYVDDVIDAFVTAASQPGIEGASIDLGTGELVSVRSVVERIVRIVGADIEPLFGALPDRPAENEIAADVDTARERLGWMATTPLDVGLSKTVDWVREVRSAGLGLSGWTSADAPRARPVEPSPPSA